MKYFQKINLFFCAIFLMLFSSVITVQAEESTQNAVEPEIYVTNVTVDKTSYKAGDVIKGTVELSNGTKTSVGAFSYNVTLAKDFDQSGNALTYYETQNSGSLSMLSKEKKSFDFQYQIPAYANGKDVAITIEVVLPSGDPMGLGRSASFSVVGGLTALTVTSGYVQNINSKGELSERFLLAEGVPIYKENITSARGTIVVKNTSNEDITIKPSISVFRGDKNLATLTSPEFSNTNLNQVTFAKGKTTNYEFDFPTLNFKPGVYNGVLELRDIQGNLRYAPIVFHYVVMGESAMIHSVVSNVSNVFKNEEFELTVSVTGEPMDVLYNRTETKHKVSIDVKVTDEQGNEVDSAVIDGDIGSFESKFVVPLIAQRDAKNLFIEATVKNEKGEVLTTYKERLAAFEETNRQKSWFTQYKYIIYAIVALLVVLAGVLVYRRQKMGMNIVGVILAVLAVSGSYAYAQYQDAATGGGVTETNMNVYFNAPANDMVFLPGAPLNISGYTALKVCQNRINDIFVTISDGNGSTTPERKIYHLGPAGEYWYTKTFSFSNMFSAPTTPGDYIAKITVKKVATQADTRWATGTYTVTRSAYQPYKVRVPVNGVCSATYNGRDIASSPDDSVLCTSGTLNSLALPSGGGNMYWKCLGANGGTNADCSARLLPTNGACSTLVNGKTLSSIPSVSTLCSFGLLVPGQTILPTPGTDGRITWSCNGYNGGTDTQCDATLTILPQNGICNSTYNGQTVSSVPAVNTLCSAGTVVPGETILPTSDANGHVYWSCNGASGGTNVQCSATLGLACTNGQIPCNGVCTTPTTSGSCPVDVCPNITGNQLVVPTGFEKNTAGDCVCTGSACNQDQCFNIAGMQIVVPTDYGRNADGNCYCSGPSCITCPAGQYVCGAGCVANNVCCGTNQTQCNGQCLSSGSTCCASGQKECNGQCIANTEACCTAGNQSCNGQCIPNGEACCSANQKSCNGQCIPDGAICCGAGTYFCDTEQKCIADSRSCNAGNSQYRSDSEIVNPSIPVAEVSEVKFRTPAILSVNPPLVNRGYTCTISWAELFSSYDQNTVCTFTGPNISSTFSPADRTSDTSTTTRVTGDTSFKMVCGQKDATGAVTNSQTANGICRVNINYVEVN